MADTLELPAENFTQRLWHFLRITDERFEAYRQLSKLHAVFHDLIAGIIVALVAIPLGVGFSIASGMRPEQGIIAGALAGIIGGLFGGSKYQVYGPTAAFITVIAAIVQNHGVGFLVLVSVIAGVILILMGLCGAGKYFKWVPHEVIIGFTVGIAATIVISQFPDFSGNVHYKLSHHTWDKLLAIPNLIRSANGFALVIGGLTFLIIRRLYRISVYIPAPLVALVCGSMLANMIWPQNFIPLISSKYPTLDWSLLRITPPVWTGFNGVDLILPVISIVFIASLESLLSSRMADRIAGNSVPYNPNKELFGQGLVNFVVPLFNGFPCTGALARTATNIKAGAVSPMASVFKGVVILILMTFFANLLMKIPMASVAGLLIFVAVNMVKPHEIEWLRSAGPVAIGVALVTAWLTITTDLAIAVSVGTVLHYGILLLLKRPLQPEV